MSIPQSAAEMKQAAQAWTVAIRQRYGLTYVARIEKLMKDRLAAAGLPTEPYTVEQTGKGKYVRGLANITELKGRSRKSEAWHAANIIDAIGYLRGTLAKKNAGEWLEEVIHDAMEIGIRMGVAGVTLDGLQKKRAAGTASNSRKAKEKWARYVEMATAIRKKNSTLTRSRCAQQIAKKTGGSVNTIRAAIAPLWKQKADKA